MTVVRFWKPRRSLRDPVPELRSYVSLIVPDPNETEKLLEEVLSLAPIRDTWGNEGRLESYRLLHDKIREKFTPAAKYKTSGRLSQIRKRLAALSSSVRAAPLLLGPFEFNVAEASVILRLTIPDLKEMFETAMQEIDQANPLTILHLDDSDGCLELVQRLCRSKHAVHSAKVAEEFFALAEDAKWDLFISETEIPGYGSVFRQAVTTAESQNIPIIFFTACPEHLVDIYNRPHLQVWKPTFGDLLFSAVRRASFWRSPREVAAPPLPLPFCFPLQGDSPAQFVPEFQSRELPHRLPKPFDWVKRNKDGRHVFVRPADARGEHDIFPDVHHGEAYELACRMVDEIVATKNYTVIVAALATLEHEMHVWEEWARNAETTSDRRRYRRATGLFGSLRKAYHELTGSERKVLEARQVLADRYARLIATDAACLRSIEWRDLESLIQHVYSRLGFSSRLTPASADQGRDIVLEYFDGEHRTILVEVKHWRSGRRVNRATVLRFANSFHNSSETIGILISTSGFQTNAAGGLNSMQRRKTCLAGCDYLQQLCRMYVSVKGGRSRPDADIRTLLPPPLPAD